LLISAAPIFMVNYNDNIVN